MGEAGGHYAKCKKPTTENTAWFCLPEEPKAVKFKQAESKMVDARG